MKKIGIYSGTFDPIHQGHTEFANKAAEEFGLDKVFLLVEPRPRRKQGVKAFEHRFKMVQLAIRNKPKLGAIRLEQARFTLRETLPVLSSRFKGTQLFMLMADDMLDHLSEWPDIDEFIGTVQLIIAARNRTTTETKQLIDVFQKTRGVELHHQIMTVGAPEYNSSGIKRALRQRRGPKGLNKNVLDYINKHRLYTTQD